jgi:glutathione S-transferase
MDKTGGVTLFGFTPSVYTRAVQMALIEKSVAFGFVEADPFEDPPSDALARLHPFGRVPVLRDGGFTLHETSAILRYVDDIAPHPPLVPAAVKARARMQQAISIMDAYGYQPLVRGVFSHLVYRPALGLDADPQKAAAGLRAAPAVLGALEDIAAEGHVLDGQSVTLADLHLSPMIGYFAMAAEGRDMMRRFTALSRWWDKAQALPSYQSVCGDAT